MTLLTYVLPYRWDVRLQPSLTRRVNLGAKLLGGRLSHKRSRLVHLLLLLDYVLPRLLTGERVELDEQKIVNLLRGGRSHAEQVALLILAIEAADEVYIKQQGRIRIYVFEPGSYTVRLPDTGELSPAQRAAAMVRGLLLRGGASTRILSSLAAGSPQPPSRPRIVNRYYRVVWELYSDLIGRWPCPVTLCTEPTSGTAVLANSRIVHRASGMLTGIYAVSDLALPVLAAVTSGLAAAYKAADTPLGPPALDAPKSYRDMVEWLWATSIDITVSRLTRAFEALREDRLDDVLDEVGMIGSMPARITVEIARR